ncbi:MAG TPA: ABC transporter substrate-binding protein, partial [Methylomirabilota bacterium]|nr:ABC transporter substrate-binding protein [Methylomirabilota bacterium]
LKIPEPMTQTLSVLMHGIGPIDLADTLWQHPHRVWFGVVRDRGPSGRQWKKTWLAGSMLALLALLAAPVSWTPAAAQTDAARTRLAAPVKVKQGMANVPALSPLWLLPEQAAKYNIQIEQILFQRFADERTALASGDLDIAAFGPQDITLGLGQGAKSMIGVAGIGSGNDCLLVRKGEDIKEWTGLGAKTIGVGAGSISWLKFAASVQENGLDYGKLRIINIVGGGGNYLKSLQGKEIDLAVVWHPFCAQGITEGWAQYPTITHNGSKTVGGLIAVLAVNRAFMEKHPEATQRLVSAYVDVVRIAQADPQRFAKIYAEKAGLPEPVASEAIRYTRFDVSLPLESIKRISKFLFDNGVIAREVSGEIGQYYTYEFLARATGRSAVDLGQNK